MSTMVPGTRRYTRRLRGTGAVVAAMVIAYACIGSEAAEMIQPRRLIDAHTAGILPRSCFDLECRVYPSSAEGTSGSGVMLGIAVGISDRLNIGVSYGGDGVIGRNKPRLNPHLGGLVKYRIFEETYFMPAIALGYDHQGFGGIDVRYDGYVFKSQGFFVAAGKNYLFLSQVQFGIHGACNYTLEARTDEWWPNGYAGIDVGFNEELALSCEYDLALNSNGDSDPRHGYINLGLRWAFSTSMYIEFDAKDILESKMRDPATGEKLGWSRELKMVYVERF